MNSNKQLPRGAGFLYLCVIIFGIFAELVVRASIIVPDDATATVANIMASESLFRIGFISDLMMMTCYLVLAFALYILLKPVNANIALLFVLFTLASVAIMCLNMLNQFAALLLLSGANYLVFGTEQLNANVMFFLELHHYGYLIAQIFFGLWLLPLGYLVAKSGYFPKTLGYLLIISCFAHLIGFFAVFLFPEQSEAVDAIVAAPSALPEFIFCFWLLWKGAKGSTQDAVAISETKTFATA